MTRGELPGRGDNRVVQGLWIGGRLSELERLCVRSFCANGHEFHLYHYDELDNVPQVGGLQLINGNEVLPCTAGFRNSYRFLAFFADHFRWELMRKRGGWWMDMDTVCVRPLNIDSDIAFSQTPDLRWMSLGALKFPRGHFLAAAIADSYKDIDKFQPWDTPVVKYHKIRRRLMFWRESRGMIRGRDAGGMPSFMRAVKHFGMQQHIVPASFFFLPGDPKGKELTQSAGWDFDKILSAAPDLRVAHLWNSNFAYDGVDKDGEVAPDSLYGALRRRYS